MSVRLAVRAVVVEAGRLLLVNAYPGEESDLWCAPGGGVEAGTSLGANLRREVREETGFLVVPERLLAVTEFHDPKTGFHQVDLLYRARREGAGRPVLADPGAVVNRLIWASEAELARLRVKPECLAAVAFAADGPVVHHPLEEQVR